MSQLTDTFTSIADAIRSKTGSSSAFTPAQMVTEIENIPTGGGNLINAFEYAGSNLTSYSGNEEHILDYAFQSCTTLTTVSFPKCSYIGGYAFQSCTRLTTISFPECSYIANYAFNTCSSLTTVSFPECSYIANYAFNACSSLTTVSFPKCSYISEYAFQRCTRLTTISFPECSYIGQYTFYQCSSLTTVSFPKCSSIDRFAFQSCRSLSSLYLLGSSVATLKNINAFNNSPLSAGGTGKIYVPNDLYDTYITATYWSDIAARITYASIPDYQYANSTITSYEGGEICIGTYAFYGCASLTTVSFPNCSYIGANTFAGCASLTTVSFPMCSYIGAITFAGCTLLSSLYLLSTSIVSLANSNAFNFTPLSAGGTGKIYVPTSLYNDYITANNWSTLSARIVSM